MPTLPSLLKKYEQLHRQYVELEREIADVQRQILDAGKSAAPRGRHRSTKTEMVEVVRATVDVLRQANETLPRREIAARLGITPWAVHYRLQQAMKLKFIERVGQGRYRITNVVPVQ